MKRNTNRACQNKATQNGPIDPYIKKFHEYLSKLGYCQNSVIIKVRVAMKFDNWLMTKHLSVSEVRMQHIEEFKFRSAKQLSITRGEVAGFRLLIEFMQQQGILRNLNYTVELSPTQKVVSLFGKYLIEKKGLSQKSVKQYSPFIAEFLDEIFKKDHIKLSSISGRDIVKFIENQAANLSVARSKVATTALRTFLRYGSYLGEVSSDLIEVVPTVACWSLSEIPRAISQEDITKILLEIPRETAIGKRDYAIIMLLSHLGLRAGEIVSLTLDSIDWESASLKIEGKNGRVASLPLAREVGEALTDYLQHGRPIVDDRAFFIRAIAPIRGFGGQETVGTIVSQAIKRSGVQTPSHGAHQFRHGLATNMLKNGATLREIGYLLRHQHRKTTNIYAKVDIESLRSISKPWVGRSL